MIIISLGQGLGNQMFQYAFGCGLKEKFPAIEIKYDTNYAFPRAHNGVELDRIFGIELNECTYEEVKSLSDRKILGDKEGIAKKAFREIRKRLGFKKESFKRQDDFTEYYEYFFEVDPNKSYYFYGTFCNSKYFANIYDNIRDKYIFPPLDQQNMKWAEVIQAKHCVSIHIRRGDYIKEGLGVLPLEYYTNAVNLIRKRFPDIEFTYLIFSNDEEFVKKEFKWLENSYIVTENSGDQSYRDMQLMSTCEHNIIANSTFSFWGAFLNRNPEKVVIGPKEPLNHCRCPFTADGWILI